MATEHQSTLKGIPIVRDLDPKFSVIINLELQGHLDDYLRYINTSDVLEDCYPARAARAR